MANGITGVLWIVLMFVLFPILNIMALPVSMLFSYLFFYAWYTAYLSHKSLELSNFWHFEMKASLLPLLLTLVYVIGSTVFFI